MIALFTILTDLTIVLFDLLIYTMIVPLRSESRLCRAVRGLGCILIVAAYALAAYGLKLPAAVAAAACMSLPSFLLFFLLSKYRDSRYVLAFCLVDTVSLMVAFFGRYISLVYPGLTWVSFLVVAVLFLALVLPGRRFFALFKELLETAEAGWGAMAAATVFIYFAMIFFLAYPKPLVERLEYAPTWMVFAAVVAACYVVFLQSVRKTKRIQEQNKRLEKEKTIYRMAYTDSLTGLGNRAAWVERINEFERSGAADGLCCIVLDCDRFKQVNDTYGHPAGDKALQNVALALVGVFPEGAAFRLGGDEFAVLLPGVRAPEAAARVARLTRELQKRGGRLGIPLSVTAGCAFSSDGGSLEDVYILADKRMYEAKRKGCEARGART